MTATTAKGIAFVLWGGHLGGAERHTVELCRVLRQEHDVDAGVVFIQEAGRSSTTLDAADVPWTALGLRRGRDVVLRSSAVAEALDSLGAQVAFLGYGGYLARAMRMGGFRGALASVEHGGILQLSRSSFGKRAKEAASRAAGERALDGTVCVSSYVRDEVLKRHHAAEVRVIYNGIDTTVYAPAEAPPATVVFGFAGRLIEGKGILQLLTAFDPHCTSPPCRLAIAGDGPALPDALAIVRDRGIGDHVDFLGVVEDMPNFWRKCSVGVHSTTHGWKESFCLSVVEAMSTGLPVIVSDEGALPEIVQDAGAVVEAGNVAELRETLARYASDDELRLSRGAIARERAVHMFDIHRAAEEYLEFANDLLAKRAGKR